jgi:CDP-diacylglycerol---serine O-phosphatidyltransferase
MVTLAGLLVAFWAIALTIEGRYEAAVWAIFVAALLDTIDGAAARVLGSISSFGQQLDSLVDLVAAGVAPALLVYMVYFQQWGAWGVLMAFAWVAAVAIRLARFNSATLVSGHFFVGVPCPIAATVVSQYYVFSQATFGNDGSPWVSGAMIVVLGALMLSRVPYWKSSTLMPRSFLQYSYGSGVVGTFLLAIPFPRQAIFVGAAVSIAAAAMLHGGRTLTRRSAVGTEIVEGLGVTTP